MPPTPARRTYAATGASDSPATLTLAGSPVSILETHPELGGAWLHSLARLAEYDCTACQTRHESAMVATLTHDPSQLVCPGCYAHRLHRSGQ